MVPYIVVKRYKFVTKSKTSLNHVIYGSKRDLLTLLFLQDDTNIHMPHSASSSHPSVLQKVGDPPILDFCKDTQHINKQEGDQ